MLKRKSLKRTLKKKSLKRSLKRKSLKRSLKRKSLKRSLKRKSTKKKSLKRKFNDGVLAERYKKLIISIINFLLNGLKYKNTTVVDIFENIEEDKTILFENEENVNLNIYFGKNFPFSLNQNIMINRQKIGTIPIKKINNDITEILNQPPKNWIHHLFPQKSDFNSFINSESNSSLNSYEILLELFKRDSKKDKDINILVGADNNCDSDYERFNNSEFYSIYISNGSYEPIRQYEMYTILYKDIVLENFPKNIISNIHFDRYVSYFVQGKEYFNIANHILKPGGKFIFEYGIQHSAQILSFKDGKYYYYNEDKEATTFLEEQKFNFIDSKFIINREFYVNNKLDPQKKVITYYDDTDKTFKQFKYEISLNYLQYCINEYTEFEITEKNFTLANHTTYPCPINYNDELFKFLSIEEKYKYNEQKYLFPIPDKLKLVMEQSLTYIEAIKK